MRKLMCKYTKLSGSSFRLSILVMYIRTAFYRYFGAHLVTKAPVFSPHKHNFCAQEHVAQAT
jgi:hypothetical protein